MPFYNRVLPIFAALVVVTCTSASADSTIAVRTAGCCSNTAPEQASVCFIGSNGSAPVIAVKTENGFGKLQAALGSYLVSIADAGRAVPYVVGPITVDGKQAVSVDLPARWLYEADGMVEGPMFTEQGQTFVATAGELDRVSLKASPGTYNIIVRKDGPAGVQVGSQATLSIGDTGWGTAQWKPGDVALETGQAYYIGIKSTSAKEYRVFLHSTGDIYPGGCAYFGGVPEPGSDLCLLISLQSDDAIRSPVLYTMNDGGWVLHTNGVYFQARSSNVRAICTRMKLKDAPKSMDAVVRVSRLEMSGSLTRIGKDKVCKCIASADGDHIVTALYGADEIPVEPGKTYFAEIIPKGEGLPQDAAKAPKRDLLVSIYGEKTPGMTPTIAAMRVIGAERTSVKVSWQGSKDCGVKISYGLTPYTLANVIDVPKGTQEADIHPISPGLTFYFKLTASTEAGGVFETPVYVTRTLDINSKPVADPPLPHVPEAGLTPLAVMDRMIQPPLPQVISVADVALANSGFEDGLTGWEVNGSRIAVSSAAHSGKSALGWDLSFSGAVDKSAGTDIISRKVKVTPGKLYMLSAYIYTDHQGGTSPDLFVRLICDPKGGTDFIGHNSTQDFRTGGRWLRFAKLWKAESDTITVGAAFSRSISSGKMLALVDDVRLEEVREPKPAWWKIGK